MITLARRWLHNHGDYLINSKQVMLCCINDNLMLLVYTLRTMKVHAVHAVSLHPMCILPVTSVFDSLS